MGYVVVVALGQTLVNSFGYGYFLVIGGLGLIFAFVFAYDYSAAIKIAHGTISGPSLSGFKQVEFELTSIDKRRTRQQSLWNKLNGLTIIYAKGGQKIRIGHTSFDKNKRAEILDILKLNEYP
jgi:hypothetical protein